MEAEVELFVPPRPSGPRFVPSLYSTTLWAYLKFLEEEVASYLTLVHLDSPIWNPLKDRLLAALKADIDARLVGFRSARIRKDLIDAILSGQIPTARNRNAHITVNTLNTNSLLEDDDESSQNIEKIKQFGRECSSPCCTGAFIVEVMMTVVLNEDVEVISFPENIKNKIYKKKPIKGFLFFDMPSVLVHYIQRLERSSRKPALRQLLFFDFNLGSIDGQLVHERILKSYRETRLYFNFPWKFSNKLARASTDMMMLTLSKLFDRPKNYFQHLTAIRLTSECLNVRLNMYGDRGGPVAIQLMAGIAYSCPVLETLDLSTVASLSPECLVYLFFQDAFSVLHKYMYLPAFLVGKKGSVYHDPEWKTASFKKHDGISYCPWCDDPATENMVRKGCEFDLSESIFVMDDRLYDFIEYFRDDSLVPKCYLMKASHYLVYCIKVSDLVKALNDDVYELERKPEEIQEDTTSDDTDEEREDKVTFPSVGSECKYQRRSLGDNGSRSPLCSTLKSLSLPMDIVDSKAWVIPLILRAASQLKSLGDCSVYDGMRIAQRLGISLREEDSQVLELEEITLSFDEFTLYKVKERVIRSLKSLTSKHPHWSNFVSTSNRTFSLSQWIEEDTDEVLGLQDFGSIRQRWEEQILSVVQMAPKLRKIRLSIKSAILLSMDKVIWTELLKLEHLSELHIYSSCWVDVLGILELLGSKIRVLNLMLNTPTSLMEDAIGSMEYVNTIPYLCPNLEEVYLGHIPGDHPHSLCSSSMYDCDTSYELLTVFESSGNITLDAFQFLWRRAKHLQTLKIAGRVVFTMLTSSAVNEVTFTKDRVNYLFSMNPMFGLKVLDIPMTFCSIASANQFLDHLPADMTLIANMTIKVTLPESIQGENFGDTVSSILGRMAAFKRDCMLRKSEVIWNWKREGMLTILLQQQMMLPVSELIDP